MVTDTAYMRNPFYHTAQDTPEKLDYDRMEAEFRSSRAALSQAQTNLGYTTLRAP